MVRPGALDAIRRGVGIGLVSAGGAVGIASALATGISIRFARRVVTPPLRREEPVIVRRIDTGSVTLSSDADTRLPGEYGLFFANGSGHARIGALLSVTRDSVTRELVSVDARELAGGTRARFSGWVFRHPRDLGFDWNDVSIHTELGDAPAWLIPAAQPSTDWVIQVHGRGAARGECLRAVPVFRESGWTSLLVSYRNDGDAPASADGRYSLGVTESRDVDSAVRYALDNGATRIVLMGWSMGGATVLQNALSPERSPAICGIVLESPVADWAATVDYHGRLLHLTSAVRWGAKWILRTRLSRLLAGTAAPIDFAALDAPSRAAALTVPVLLMHSKQDGYVPFAPAEAFARARPDLIRLEVFTRARHAKLWNYDRARWNDSIRDWLAALPSD